jgi:hypothetical protein
MANDFVKNGGAPARVTPKMGPAKSAFGKRGAGPQNKGAIILVDDDSSIIRLSKRMMGRSTSKDILDAGTVDDAIKLITKNDVSLVVLDRNLGDGEGAEDIIFGMLQVCPQKMDSVVIHSGDPWELSPEVKEILGRNRIFQKGDDSELGALLELVKHVEAGGSVKGWEKPFC